MPATLIPSAKNSTVPTLQHAGRGEGVVFGCARYLQGDKVGVLSGGNESCYRSSGSQDRSASMQLQARAAAQSRPCRRSRGEAVGVDTSGNGATRTL